MALTEAERSRMTRAGLNLIQQAISIYDADLRLAVWNDRFKEMFDLPERLVTRGASFAETIRHLVERGEYGEVEDVEAWVTERVALAQAFEPHYVERRRANGRVVSIEGAPLPMGGWVTVYTDITGTKQQEDLLRARSESLSDQLLSRAEELSATNRALAATNTALEQAKRELMEMEQRTRLTAEMMPAHIARVGTDQRYTYSNRRLSSVMPERATDILGMTMREALGRHAWAQIEPHFAQALLGEGSVFEFTEEVAGRRIRVALTPDEAEGGVRGVYILSMDVTEEVQARTALGQTMKRELAAQMTSGMAHDFANLLTIMIGMQSKLARMDLQPDALALVEATKAAVARGGSLLEKIASVSSPREMHPAPTDLNRLLADLRLLAEPSLPEHIALKIDAAPLEGLFHLDAGALQDSLLNLVINARDSLGATPGEIRLTLRAQKETWIEIEVSDTGPGFSEIALRRGLDPFFTTKGGEGSGLGLSMVYDSTKLAGGQVRLANTRHGASVTLRLPFRRLRATWEPTLVVLVEDSPEIRESVRDMLTELGHSVIEAESAEEALALAHLPGVGLVLSDIMLAGDRTGLSLLDELRQAAPQIPGCLMTSLPPGDPLRQQAAARYPLLAKPFGAGSLARFLDPQEEATP
ncbi:PAS-domain containing protein [Pseudoruegeria sp. SHC-113]|uniref:PAS-domain containing protein n=1 Tax=Pseudoruegeria sp. SHC-113 TaxID=2855439 RepID=UPI0021BB30DC|nr:PAS-domain containing protein [Pseudoruegeria sp. SHC-113]MCT8162041.1 PAS-domain containing protein [Pseudoruegeria sp. SHC-113]